jgi:hypothetical protein
MRKPACEKAIRLADAAGKQRMSLHGVLTSAVV